MATKQAILDALTKFLNQRPRLEFGNYGDIKSYRSELRSILKDKHDAETLLQAVRWRDSITAEDIIKASEHAFSGRLSITTDGDKVSLDYCTGQYWPTEYRRAACAVLAQALWDYFRDQCGGHPRDVAKQEFSRSICKRWFN